MNPNWQKAIAFLLALVLIATLSFGCGKKAEKGVVIVIGELTDLTGPASPAIRSLHYALEDMVRYYNEEDLIPGTELRIVSWDTQYLPSRAIPGYDWVREKGAKLIISIEPPTGVVLKPFADKDHFPVANLSTNMAMLEPPGWVFTMSSPHYNMIKTLLKWISEEHWDQQGIAKVGIVGWDEPVIAEQSEGMEDYCQEHPDQFEYAGAHITPFGTGTWTAEVEKLKDCDYICALGFPMPDFVNQFQARGYSATFIDVGVASAYRGYFVEKCGWAALDGTLSANVSLYRDQSTPMVEQAKLVLQRYHSPGEAKAILDEGFSYPGGWHNLTAVFEILKNAIEEVGAENFDGQAFYNAAVEYRTTSPLWEGYPEGWGFTETKRYLVNDITIYEFNAQAEDLVRITDYWLPLEE